MKIWEYQALLGRSIRFLLLTAVFCLMSSTAFAQDSQNDAKNQAEGTEPHTSLDTDSSALDTAEVSPVAVSEPTPSSDVIDAPTPDTAEVSPVSVVEPSPLPESSDDSAYADDSVYADNTVVGDEDAYSDEDAYADENDVPSGKMIYFGITAPMQIDTHVSRNIAVAGGGLHIKVGYRWGQAAMFLDQSFTFAALQREGEKDGFHYMASTYWMFEEYAAFGKKWMFNIGAGIGVIYGDHDSVARSGSYGCVSIKLETGLEYRFTNSFSVGVNFAYALGIVEKQGRVEKAKDGLLHYISPAIGFSYVF